MCHLQGHMDLYLKKVHFNLLEIQLLQLEWELLLHPLEGT